MIRIELEMTNPTLMITENGCYTKEFKTVRGLWANLNPHSNKLRDFKIGCDCKGREMGDHGERITNITYVL